jgi:hypothetical protein
MSVFNNLNDDGKLKQRYYNKRSNAAKENIEFLLSPKQFMQLMVDAGITSSDCGVKGYHLARNNDTGPYKIGNCSFVWYLVNLQEKRVSKRMQQASRRNGRRAADALRTLAKTRRGRHLITQRIKDGQRAYVSRIRARAKQRQRDRQAGLHPSYAGVNNSQFGTYWITDGTTNMKWNDDKGRIPKKFFLGRSTN